MTRFDDGPSEMIDQEQKLEKFICTVQYMFSGIHECISHQYIARQP
jgi:hypothetical protein